MPDSLQIPYTELRNALREVSLRPILSVAILTDAKLVNSTGLVDSGADVNVLPFELGNALGLTWGEQRYHLRLSGNLANFDTRVVVLPVQIGTFARVDLAFAGTQAERV